MGTNINIGGRLHSTATGNVVTGADEILDDTKGAKQSAINAAVDAALDNRYTKSETYSRTQLDNMITTPNQEYVTVEDYASLPESGEADTIYRVANWDGSLTTPAVDITKYSEYAWDGTEYVFLCVKSQVGEVFDISAANSGATYADLAAALDGGGNVPEGIRKGGMSIKYVRTSDNKYVQYRLMADDWSVDTEDWAIADDGVYVENPEFVYVKTDNEDKILYGVKQDGEFFFGAGCPQQVKDYIKERISELPLDEYEDIVAFLQDFLGTDTTLKMLLDSLEERKVDKVEGKSLIDSEYAASQSVIDSPEWADIKTDAENKILEGIQADGTKIIGGDIKIGGSASINGDTKILGNMKLSGVSYKVIENPEYLAAWVDASDKVVFGLKADGKTYVGDADFLDDIKDNKEAIAEINSTLASINENLSSIDIEALSSITTVENPEYIKVETDSEGKILSGRKTDGTKFENVGFSTPKVSIDGHTLENTEDPEGRSEVTTDSEGKVISYRDSEGVKHENAGIETKTLIVDGFSLDNYVDNKTLIQVERPKFAEFYFYGNLPTDESDERTPTNLKVVVRVNNQTIFSSKCTLAIQGHGSLEYRKKNFTLDFLNSEGDELAVKFGDMISVNSYHLKGYYSDPTHSRGIGGMNFFREMVKYLEPPFDKINNIPLNINSSQNIDCLALADAKYGEDGFPVSMYLNDSFYGLYTIKLKKTRQNYAMQKSVKNQIFLDSINAHALLYEPFDYTQWELKNPKLKGYKEGGEIKDAAVLASINRLFGFLNDIPSQYQNYADYIVLPHWLATYIFAEIIGHEDFMQEAGGDFASAHGNNEELFTWDNVHWSILPYDLDNSVGLNGMTMVVETSKTGFIITGLIFQQLKTYFDTELKQLYTKLRNLNVISVDNVYRHYVNQCSSIPREIYKQDYEIWGTAFNNNSPQYASIEQIYSYIKSRIEYLDSQWLINN